MMSAVDQALGSKALPPDAGRIAETLNRETLPVLRKLRAYINGSSYSAAFGDGVATSFTFTHGLGTRLLVIMVYDSATFEVLDITGLTVTLTDEDTLDVSGFGAPPAADELTLVVKR
jgi:hypothetical protein